MNTWTMRTELHEPTFSNFCQCFYKSTCLAMSLDCFIFFQKQLFQSELLLLQWIQKKICTVCFCIHALHHPQGVYKHSLTFSNCRPLVRERWWGAQWNFCHQAQQRGYLSLDSSCFDPAKAWCPFTLLWIAASILSAAATPERSQQDNYPPALHQK